METSQAGIDLIKSFESLRLHAYPDPATGGEPITIGYGHTGGVRLSDVITKDEAEEFLREDLERFETCVHACVGQHVSQSGFDACVSLAFNIGEDAFEKSTLVKKIRAGDMTGAADEFLRWNRAGGRVMTGLTRRRQAERALFLS